MNRILKRCVSENGPSPLHDRQRANARLDDPKYMQSGYHLVPLDCAENSVVL